MSDILESKGYLYVNAEGKIMSVTTNTMEVTDLIEVIVSKQIAQQFMDGIMSMYDWTVTIDDNGFTLTSNRNISRDTRTTYQHPTLIKVEHINFTNSPITITIKQNTIRIDNNTGNTARFYITRKNDPSILYRSITVDDTITELLPTSDVDIHSFTISAARIIHED